MLPTLRPVPSAPCDAGTALRRLVLRVGVTAGLGAGLALPLVAVALPASAARSATVQDAPPQATVEPVEGACGVRVTLSAGVGPRTVTVTARTVDAAADAPVGAPGDAPVGAPADAPAGTAGAAGREVVVEDGGRWSATAGAARAFALELAGAATAPEAVSRVEVTVTVDGPVPQATLFLADCRAGATPTLTPVPSTTPTGTPTATPVPGPGGDAGAAPTSSAGPTVTPTTTAAPSATPTVSAAPSATPTVSATPSATATVVGTSAPRPAPGVDVPGRSDTGGSSSRRSAAGPVPAGALPGGAVLGGSGNSGTVALGGVPFTLPGVASPFSAGPGAGVAQLPALAAPGPVLAPQPAAAPLPQLALPEALFPPALVPSSGDDQQEQVAFQMVRPPAPSADAVADLLPAGTALGLCVLALRGMVGRRRA